MDKNIDLIENEKLKRLNSWFSGKNGFPVKVVLFPTDRCNLNCEFCWRHNEPMYKEELDKKHYRTFIDQCSQFGVKEILISGGGEPLLHDGIINIMESIKKKNIRGTLITNGTLFNKEDINKLVDIGWDIIEFSIEGMEEINDSLRDKGSFRKIISALDLFNEYKN